MNQTVIYNIIVILFLKSFENLYNSLNIFCYYELVKLYWNYEKLLLLFLLNCFSIIEFQ